MRNKLGRYEHALLKCQNGTAGVYYRLHSAERSYDPVSWRMEKTKNAWVEVLLLHLYPNEKDKLILLQEEVNDKLHQYAQVMSHSFIYYFSRYREMLYYPRNMSQFVEWYHNNWLRLPDCIVYQDEETQELYAKYTHANMEMKL